MSRRNNEDRMGANQSSGAEPPPQAANQTLNFVVPTEFVELPSKGKYYPENHPLYMKENIEIRHMTAKDEDILTSRTLLKQGVALQRFMSNIIVDKNIKLESLLVGDKNAIIVAARISGYGPEYQTRIGCPACLENVEFTFNLLEGETKEGSIEDDSSFMTDHGTLMVKLPTTGVDLETRFMTGRDEDQITKSMKSKKKKNPDVSVTHQLSRMIVSVNGDNSVATIRRFISVLPARDSRHLRNIYKKASPNVDLTQMFECSECGHEQALEVPFTADFFWPDR